MSLTAINYWLPYRNCGWTSQVQKVFTKYSKSEVITDQSMKVISEINFAFDQNLTKNSFSHILCRIFRRVTLFVKFLFLMPFSASKGPPKFILKFLKKFITPRKIIENFWKSNQTAFFCTGYNISHFQIRKKVQKNKCLYRKNEFLKVIFF